MLRAPGDHRATAGSIPAASPLTAVPEGGGGLDGLGGEEGVLLLESLGFHEVEGFVD